MAVEKNMDTYNKDISNAVAQVVAAYAQRGDASTENIVELARRLMPIFGAAQPQADTQTASAAVKIAASASMTPALPLDQAVTEDKVFCLCCGRGFTMLKRHLNAEHGLSEDDYRKAFGLPETMPLVAPSYSDRKAAYAKEVGLGKYSRDAGLEETTPAR
ncbi:MucR family transcriptional regulator [Cognatishimia sp. SS12]|uniref:MucR family transcriptional regulator n=1 Tax=Cognatishimia sp. SS12 TaxID=2979465 RepID=UPI00232AF28B|nr:MucR family transcriptional regulator [Cognatishimia sp. SS12]MDC0739450.1 MucR family transcriptional regulator [Cognatishimia sp. SS12]